jgi:chitinase
MSSGTRISPLRVGILFVITLAVIGTLVYFVRPAVITASSPGPTTFAGYVDVTLIPAYPFETPEGPAQQNVVLAFVVAGRDAPCEPTWGTYYTLSQATDQLQLDRRISQLRLTGGQPRVSFGGAANQELSVSCTDQRALVDAYAKVVDQYELTSIDLDVEGPNLEDQAANTRRAQAIKTVQDTAVADGRVLDVWLTLPVNTSGLTTSGIAAVSGMLSAGVNLSGVNGMAMNFGGSRPQGESMSQAVIDASTALQAQVRTAFGAAGTSLDAALAWSRVGITPMIGQNDVPGEVFTMADAKAVNEFARTQGAGMVSMWDLNRDATCTHPLPAILTVVQNTCSGVDQEGQSFANVLGADTEDTIFASGSATPSAKPSASATSPTIVDDPAHSPFPIWDPLGTYPADTKVVWKKQVYQAKWWTSGFAPDTPVTSAYDTPWTLLGPVLPGDTPAPLPTVAANTYPQWDAATGYVAGSRVQLGLVPYQAKWWTQGQRPSDAVSGGSPWMLVNPD